ncbi:hypothetical protein [Paenibacillus sp. y28]|uniref:hypothetical protein n=1 Tax=Paenibacillus sp. y28 TaxID=3129110 RepID=UPI00301AE739
MNIQWVDCYIDKLLTMYPEVKPYAAMIDRWAFVPEWTEAGVSFDLTRVLQTEQQLIELYGIQRYFTRGWIDEALQEGQQVLLPCDLFFMPHAAVFYGKEHAGHYILVQRRLEDGRYLIFDDHPGFSGEMSRSVLELAHQAMDLPFQAFKPGCKAVTDETAVSYVIRQLRSDSFNLGDFAKRLLAAKLPPARICGIVKETRHMQHRLQGLVRMLETAPVPASSRAAIDEMQQAVIGYMDAWRATVNLAVKGLLLPAEALWSRLEQRLMKHAEGDDLLRKAVAQLRDALIREQSIHQSKPV